MSSELPKFDIQWLNDLHHNNGEWDPTDLDELVILKIKIKKNISRKRAIKLLERLNRLNESYIEKQLPEIDL